MSRIDKAKALYDKLLYFVSGGYTTQDTLRSLCKDAAFQIGDMEKAISHLTTQVEQLKEAHKNRVKLHHAVMSERTEYKRLLDETKSELAAYREAGYREAEQDGRLVVLPCKVGDRVFELNKLRNLISELEIWRISLYDGRVFFEWNLIDGIYQNVFGFYDFEISKTVFLTRKAAIQRDNTELEGMK